MNKLCWSIRGAFHPTKFLSLSWGRFWWPKRAGSRTFKSSFQDSSRKNTKKNSNGKIFPKFFYSRKRAMRHTFSWIFIKLCRNLSCSLEFRAGRIKFLAGWKAIELLILSRSALYRGGEGPLRPTLRPPSPPASHYTELKSTSIVLETKALYFDIF